MPAISDDRPMESNFEGERATKKKTNKLFGQNLLLEVP